MPLRPRRTRRTTTRLGRGQTPPARLAYLLNGTTIDDHTIELVFSTPVQRITTAGAFEVMLDGSSADIDSYEYPNGRLRLTLLDNITGVATVEVHVMQPNSVHVGLALSGSTSISFPGLP